MQPTATHLAPEAPLALNTLLHALAAEIEAVAAGCRDLESLVSETAVGAGGASVSTVARLQAFDFILQTLGGMKIVLVSVAEEAPLSWVCADRVLGDVPLAALARRLSGRAAGVEPGVPDVDIW